MFYPLASQPKDSPGVIRVIQVTISNDHSCKLKYLTEYVRVMNVTQVDFVFVCRRSNFASFKRPRPESLTDLRSTSLKRKGKDARAENKQYNALLAAMREIWEANPTLEKPSINFRKVRMNIL